MNDERFDNWSRRLARGGSRRQALRLMASSALGVALAGKVRPAKADDLPAILHAIFGSATDAPSVVDTSYTADTDPELMNPERGIYYWPGSGGSYHTIIAQWLYLGSVCNQSLTWNGHNQPGTSSVLNLYATKLVNHRAAGKKVLFRPRYDVPGDVTLSSNVCGKFQADTKLLQLDHIDAVAAMLGKFKDVVAFIEAGYLGQYGEWHTADDPGAAPLLDSVSDRADIVDHILLKYGEAGLLQHVGLRRPVFAKEVIDRKADALVGIYNDCFMSNEHDYGTYSNFDKDCVPPNLGNCNRSNFPDPVEEKAKAWALTFTADATFGGETCPVDANDDNISDGTERWWLCSNMVGANSEPGSLHMSYLHGGYANEARPAWKDGDLEGNKCYDEIRRKLGYRFEVSRVEYTPTVAAGQRFQVRVDVTNTGWAKLHKPRQAKLVLRNGSTPLPPYLFSPYEVDNWAPGQTTTISVNELAPSAGTYSVWIWIPDPDAEGRTPYAVKLATVRNGANVFDPNTGENNLGVSIIVQ